MIWVDEGASVTYVHESASEPGRFQSSCRIGGDQSFSMVQTSVLSNFNPGVTRFGISAHERAQSGARCQHGLDIWCDRISSLPRIFPVWIWLLRVRREECLVSTSPMANSIFDHDTHQNHIAPNTTSDLLFKGALKRQQPIGLAGDDLCCTRCPKNGWLSGKSQPGLDPAARADSIPGLEILADDVRCTHGATVGKIDRRAHVLSA